MTLEENMQNQTNKPQSFKGLPLFNEIEDEQLRRRNQAVVMTNLLEDNYDGGKITAKAAAMISGFYRMVPEAERPQLLEEFKQHAAERGFVLPAYSGN